MNCQNRVRYRLPWPGLPSIPLYIIDTNDVVYSSENRLPPSKRHINCLGNHYIKMHSLIQILQLASEQTQVMSFVTHLISEFGLRSLRTIACYKATPFGQEIVVDQYLPLATLLSFLLVFPSKSFDRIRDCIFGFLDMYRDIPCMGCGFINRNCQCPGGMLKEAGDDDFEAIGYAVEYSHQSVQTGDATETESDEDVMILDEKSGEKRLMSKRIRARKLKLQKAAKIKAAQAALEPGEVKLKKKLKTMKNKKKSSDMPPNMKLIEGPGGIRVYVPNDINMDPGARMPLGMGHGHDGPYLAPMGMPGMPVMPSPVPGTSLLPHPVPGNSLLPHPVPGTSLLPHPMPGTSLLPHPMPGTSLLPSMPYGPPPVSMMPPLQPPVGYPGAPMPLPPVPQLPATSGQSLLPTSTTASTRMPPPKSTMKPGMASHCVEVFVPGPNAPKYLSTNHGTYKRLGQLRNVGIQVETIILPKKPKNDPMINRTFGKVSSSKTIDMLLKNKAIKKVKKVSNADKKKGDVPDPDGKVVIKNKSKDQTSSVSPVSVPSSPGTSGAPSSPANTSIPLVVSPKVDPSKIKIIPPKKVDKVWKLIDDDEDSDEEMKPDKDKDGEKSEAITEKDEVHTTATEKNEANVDTSKPELADVPKEKSEEQITNVKAVDLDEQGGEPMEQSDPMESSEKEATVEPPGDKLEETSSETKENQLEPLDGELEKPAEKSPASKESQTRVEESPIVEEFPTVEKSSTDIVIEPTDEQPVQPTGDDTSTAPEPQSKPVTGDSTASVQDSLPSLSSSEKESANDTADGYESSETVGASDHEDDDVIMAEKEDLSKSAAVINNNVDVEKQTSEPDPRSSPIILDTKIVEMSGQEKEPSIEGECLVDTPNTSDSSSFLENSDSVKTSIEPMESEEDRRRSLAAEALESLANMANFLDSGPVQTPVSVTSETLPSEKKITENLFSGENQDNNIDNSDAKVSTTDSVDLTDSKDDIDSESEKKLVIVEDGEVKPDVSTDKVTDSEVKPEQPDKKESSEADKGDCAVKESAEEKEDAKKSHDIFAESDDEEKAVAPRNPNHDSEKKYFAKFEHLPTGEKLYRCTFPTCAQCFDTRVATKQHNMMHSKDTKVRQLLCLTCDYKVPFFKWFDLLRHLRETHKTGLTEDPNGCMFCGLIFETPERLARHMEFHYSSRYKCVHCGIMMMSWGQVKLHMETCPEKEQSKVNFGCPYCMFVFHKKTIRNLHMLSHADTGLSCALCDDHSVQWEHWKLLRKHYQTRHAKVLTSKVGPFRHMLPKKKKNPKCHMCGEEFKAQEEVKAQDLFNAHMFKVHDLVPYTLESCRLCDKTFRTKRRMEWHFKHVHEQEAACEECDFVAKNKSMLRVHMNQKHSEKQQMCTECGKGFTYYHQLRIHMAHHARRIVHTCKTCGEEFTRSAELRRHNLEAHSDDANERKVHNCPDCEYWTYTRSTLAYHIQKKHQGGDEDSDGPSAPSEVSLNSLSNQDVNVVDTDADPDFVPAPTRSPAPRRSPADGRNTKRKKRKRLTMQRRTSTPRASKDNDVTHIRTAKERKEIQMRARPVSERKRGLTEEEEMKRVKRLRKTSAARTRSYEDQKACNEGGELEYYEMQAELAKQGQTSPASGKKSYRSLSREECAMIHLTYPYIDHNYYQLDTQVLFDPFKPPVRPPRRPSSLEYSSLESITSPVSMEIVSTPAVADFEVCVATQGQKRTYNRRKNSGTIRASPLQSPPDVQPMSSTPAASSYSRLQSPVQIRSLLTRALHASPTKAHRDKMSSLSQQLRSLAGDPLSADLRDIDFPELISEAGDMLPEQDLSLITDILNSMDTANMVIPNQLNIGSRSEGESQDGTDIGLALADQGSETAQTLFNHTAVLEIPLEDEPTNGMLRTPSTSEIPLPGPTASGQSIPSLEIQTAVDDVEMETVVEPTTPTNTSLEESLTVNNGELLVEPSRELPVAPPSVVDATDLDEIELKDVDYQLWHDSPQGTEPPVQPLTDFSRSLASAQIIVEFKDQEEGETSIVESTERDAAPELVIVAENPVSHQSQSPTRSTRRPAWLLDHQYF